MQKLEMHDTKGMAFLAVAESGGHTYFSAWNHNGLFQLHEDGKADFIMLFDKYGSESPKHEFAIGIRDIILFIPSSLENEIVIFTPKNRKIEYLEYPVSEKKCMYRPFWGYVSRNNIIYLLPNSYDAVLTLDLDSREFIRYVLPVEGAAFYEEKSVIISGILVGETVYFCPWNCSNIISFDLETYEYKVLGKVKKNTFRHMFYIDKKFFLIPRSLDDSLVIYDTSAKVLLQENIPHSIKGICVCAFTDEKNNIYFLPNNEKKIWIWNPISEDLSSIDIGVSNENKKNALNFNEARDLWNGKIISTDWDTLSHLIFDGKGIKVFDICTNDGIFLDILMSMIKNQTEAIFYEY